MNKKLSIRKKIGLEIFRKIRHNNAKLHELNTLFWECTLRCNLNCKHCGSDCHVQSEVNDMPINDFLRAVDEITPHINPNKTMIIFTGGEALLRKDLEICGLELFKRGFPWGLVSNGLALTQTRLKSLLEAGLHSITISFDGFAESHNWLRGNSRSYNQALNAIKMLTKVKGIAWDVVTCVNKQNINELNQLKEFLIETGVKDWRLFTIFPVGRAAELPELQLSNEEFTSVLEFIRLARIENRIHVSYGCEGFLGNYEQEVRDHFYTCHAGIHVASVLADGSISACPSIRSNFHQGNIYTDNFADVWNNRFEQFRDRAWAKQGKCADCEMWRYCEGNGMHLHDDSGELLICHHERIAYL